MAVNNSKPITKDENVKTEKEVIPELTLTDILLDEDKVFEKTLVYRKNKFLVKYINLTHNEWSTANDSAVLGWGAYQKKLIFMASIVPKFEKLEDLDSPKIDRDFIRSYATEIDRQFKNYRFL